MLNLVWIKKIRISLVKRKGKKMLLAPLMWIDFTFGFGYHDSWITGFGIKTGSSVKRKLF